LFYGKEAIVPLYYLIPSLCISTTIDMTERGAMQEIFSQLVELEEDITIAGFPSGGTERKG
jgi:hypothetical protein